MSITDPNGNTKTAGLGAGAKPLEATVRRWRVTVLRIRKAVASIRGPRIRADIQRLIDAHWTGRATGRTPEPGRLPEPARPPRPEERSEALAAMCEALLRQFDGDEAGAAEIRLVVHKRGEPPAEPTSGSRPESSPATDAQEAERVWGLRQLLASAGAMITDVAQALETRGGELDREGRELLQDEVSAIEVDMAVLKTLLADEVEWDEECRRLLADEVPPFEDAAVDDDLDDEDD